jgi:pimeloyl-ACP methyl ester carboxylesterase
LIIRLIKYLNVSKVILCAHSLGSIFSSYFITKYPNYVEGYINITGIVDHWYTGLMTFFQTVITENNYNSQEWRGKNLIDDDHQRILLHHQFFKNRDGRSFGPVEFPQLSITEFFGYFKLINSMPHGLSELYNLNKHLKILRVLIFGKKDPLHEHHKTEASIYNVCWGKESYTNLP